MSKQKCPSCGGDFDSLLNLDGGFKQRLREAGETSVHDTVCNNCYSSYSGIISQGAQLRAKEQARAQHRMNMWRNRVVLLKQARQHMTNKSYTEAAVLYEKYLKLLEVIYEIPAGKLTPDVFKNKARQKELTVITTVYWDLVRIYDSGGNYADRLQKSIEKLLLFAPHSSILVQLSKNAIAYTKQARNPEIFRNLQKQFGIQRKGCFIATAAFESPEAVEVQLLRRFRDDWLSKNKIGQTFIEKYYDISPSIAAWMQRNPNSKRPARTMLRVITFCLEKIL
ncbi:MAG: CFI-box-CTERM domain-containing protein [Bdellovibrionales bacterium]